MDLASDERHLITDIVSRVSEATDTAPEDLPPIYTVVDPDALELLFASTGKLARTEGRVHFEYGGCEVVVHADGPTVEVVPPEGIEVGEPPTSR